MVKKEPILLALTQELREIKYSWLLPVLHVLTKLKLTANGLSTAKLFLLIPAWYILPKDPALAGWIFAWMLLLDMIDGPLAIFQKKASDRGAFIDSFTDILLAVLSILIFTHLGLIGALIAAYYIFITLVANLLSTIYYNEGKPSNWIIKPNPNLGLYKIALLISLFAYMWFANNWFYPVLLASNTLLSIQALYFYFAILYRWKRN